MKFTSITRKGKINGSNFQIDFSHPSDWRRSIQNGTNFPFTTIEWSHLVNDLGDLIASYAKATGFYFYKSPIPNHEPVDNSKVRKIAKIVSHYSFREIENTLNAAAHEIDRLRNELNVAERALDDIRDVAQRGKEQS